MARPGLPRTDLGPTALLVKLLRKVLLGCPQVEMSARSGVDADLISRYENGTIRQPTSRNLDRLLSAAGVLDVKQPLLLTADHLSALLNPPPPSPPGDDPLRLGELLQRTSQRLLQSDSRLLTGEYIPPIRRDLVAVALLTRFLRAVLLDCSLGELSRRTGINRDVLSRYEAGRVRKPDPANLDRLLAEAQVLHLKEPLLRAMSDLSAVLSHQPQPAAATVEPNLLSPSQVDSFLAFATDLLHRTSLRLGLECEKFSPPVLEDGLDFREE
ncbi:MAG TPA: helix-turn-helix transcriptional regulator [Thermoanaerobaculia bacterium]|nr:helix-turn-helix transcriptional regulator [Thermoanaerobaculia bacterium]